jgi:sulfate adenylyltransferase
MHSLLVTSARRDELRAQSSAWPSWTLSGDTLTELEALIAGFLWPVQGYRTSGEPGAAPLDVPAGLALQLVPGSDLALRDPEGVLVAALHVEDRVEVKGVSRLVGPVEGLELPAHDDFSDLRLTPGAVAERTRALGRPRVLACFPGLLHAGTRAALLQAADRLDAGLLVLLGASATEHDELADFARIRALQISASLLPPDRTMVAVVPVPGSGSMTLRLLRTAVIARNCGASHLAIDVAETDSADFEELRASESQTGVTAVPVRPWAYSRQRKQLVDPDTPDEQLEPAPSSREVLFSPTAAPPWLLSTAEWHALQRAYPARHSHGFTVFFTGLSGSGKSTIARAVRVRLMEMTGRPVTLLDGDRVRRHLSSELGFSREHRNLNILRIGWVASEITRHGGIAICAPIAPYDSVRRQVREMVEPAGGFLLVHVSTPLETCEGRDRKGLYAKARAGLIPQFTGVSDPYEAPADAAVTVDTRYTSVGEACTLVIEALVSRGYLVQDS